MNVLSLPHVFSLELDFKNTVYHKTYDEITDLATQIYSLKTAGNSFGGVTDEKPFTHCKDKHNTEFSIVYSEYILGSFN